MLRKPISVFVLLMVGFVMLPQTGRAQSATLSTIHDFCAQTNCIDGTGGGALYKLATAISTAPRLAAAWVSVRPVRGAASFAKSPRAENSASSTLSAQAVRRVLTVQVLGILYKVATASFTD